MPILGLIVVISLGLLTVRELSSAAHNALATLAPNGKHKIATKSSHYIQLQEPQLVIDAIKQVVEAVRNPSAWKTAP